jgi:hypothetical protein
MRLEEIGFYTLSDARAASASASSPLWRCELILTGRCNFRCPYCRQVGGADIPAAQAQRVLRLWMADGLRNIRFSGGEPTIYPNLADLVRRARDGGVRRIAISTNGSASRECYSQLLDAGVNDVSVSLDACCAEDGDRMAGGVKGAWFRVMDNLRWLSARTYVTAGVVLTADNTETLPRTIAVAHEAGVADIRIIPAAQVGRHLPATVPDDVLGCHPILRYRIGNVQTGRPVRGLGAADARRCGLVLDDMAVMGEHHYPCIIYMREGGAPIGTVGPRMRQERLTWARNHDTHKDPICRRNCLDVCVDYNNCFRDTNPVSLTGSRGDVESQAVTVYRSVAATCGGLPAGRASEASLSVGAPASACHAARNAARLP